MNENIPTIAIYKPGDPLYDGPSTSSLTTWRIGFIIFLLILIALAFIINQRKSKRK